MRLLIVTQKVDQDDSYFGFFHDWLRAFSASCEQVTVITLERRRYTLPGNVAVHSLGKENGSSRLKRLFLFWKYAWQYRASYDAVFCHMSPLYVIAGYPLWKPLRKKIALWYSHRQVDLKLRIAVALAGIVFSTSPHAFRLRTRKVRFMGHAIDVDSFKRPQDYPKPAEPRIVSVGRLTPIKRLEVLITAIAILARRSVRVKGIIVGAPLVSSDYTYAAALKDLAEKQAVGDSITFAGNISFERVREMYWKSSISVNLAPTGGMDKVVLEAAATGLPVMVTNAAFAPLLEGYEERLIFEENNTEDLANKIEALLIATDKETIGGKLQERIRAEYSLSVLVSAIIHKLETP